MKYFKWLSCFLLFALIGLLLFCRGFMEKKDTHASGSNDVSYVIGEQKFKIPKEYLYSLLIRAKERKIKDRIVADYFSIDVLYPDMVPVNIDKAEPGWGNRIMVYLRNRKMFDTKKKILNWTDGKGEPVDEHTQLYKQRSGSGKESSGGDKDIYIYKDHDIYMSCDTEGGQFTPPYPSCKIVSEYKGMEMSASFSSEHKREFVQINNLIFQLLSTFE